MSDVYKLQYNGMTLAYPGWNGYVAYNDIPSYRTLTLQTDGHGTLTASVLTGLPGDTVTLTPTYNTYYRFNNYSVTGGTIAGNTFTFGNEDATAQANFKVNYFTATGNFEKGSNVVANGSNAANPGVNQTRWTYSNVPAKYALHQSHTGDISTAWYSTSNRWKPNDASAYSITLNTKCTFTAGGTNGQSRGATAVSLLGSTQTQSQTFASNNAATWNYNKSVTTTSQNILYGLSGRVGATKFMNSMMATTVCTATYVANNTNGTWTATGIAP